MSYHIEVGGSVNATQVQASIDTRYVKSLLLVNDGTNSVFFLINQPPATYQTTVNTSNFELKAGETIIMSAERGISNVLYVCNTGETATMRYKGWY